MAAGIAEDAERAEARGWEDLVRAAPTALARAHAIESWRVDDAVGFSFASPAIPLFNRVIGLGVLAPATPVAIDAALGPWQGTGTTYVVHGMPDERPPDLSLLFEARGLNPSRNWIKMTRQAEAVPEQPIPPARIEEIGADHAAAFGEFAAGMAGLPDFASWLGATVGRPGWHTYLAFDEQRAISGGQLFIADGVGWLFNGEHAQVERPEVQRAIAARRVNDGIALGCRLLVSEVGEPTTDEPNAGHEALLSVGFEPAYRRRNWIGTAASAAD